MQTIGERLLEARQRRGVSIREAAEATKVRGDYLSAMEANHFDTIPLADVYRRGFLKIYCQFLRLDPERVVGDFNALLAARNPAAPWSRRATDIEPPTRSADTREVESLDDFASGAIEVAARPERRRRQIVIAGGASLLLLALVWALLPARRSDQPETAPQEKETQAAASLEGEVAFVSEETKPVDITVTRDADRKVVYATTLAPGATATMRGSGNLTLTATGRRIRFSVNGGAPMQFPAGYTSCRISVPVKER